MPARIEVPNLPNLLRRYQAGEPEQKLAREAGVNRWTFRKRLTEAGIIPRNVSDSMFIRWAEATPKAREAMLTNAHRAARGRKQTIAERILRANTRERNVTGTSPVELELCARLSARGLSVTPQKAIHTYNVDIALNAPPIAVEIFGGNFHSTGLHARRHFPRTKYLLDHGWSVVIIWIDARRYPLSVGCDDYIIQFAEELRRNPAAGSQYRVIRGDGNPAPALRSYLNTPADIKRLGHGYGVSN